MINYIKILLFILVPALTTLSCRQNTVENQNTPPPQSQRGVFIVNEGAWPNAGTVSYYNISKDSVVSTIVGASAGWITPNDAKLVKKKLYVVLNGSDAIGVLNSETFASVGSISFADAPQPGFMTIASDSIAYVVTYGGMVCRVNLDSMKIKGISSSIVDFPGGIIFANNKVFVSNTGYYTDPKHLVKVLDPINLTPIDSINVGVSPGTMALSSNGTLYIVCAGSYPSSGKVYAINSMTDHVTDSIAVGVGPSDIGLAGGVLYVLHADEVMKLSTPPLHIIDTTFIHRSTGLYYYSMGIDKVTGDVYVGNVTANGGSGVIEVYRSSGIERRSAFTAGVFPGAFEFKE